MPELKIKRKLFRTVGLLFPALYAAGDAARAGAGWIAACAVLAMFLLVMLALEYARFRRPGVNRWLFSHFSGFTKEKERERMSSTTLFLLSCLLAILIFNKAVAIAAMLMLVFGDPVAEMIGVRWGRVPLLGKTLEGTMGGLAACLLASAPLAATSLGPAPLVLAAGAAAAALFELIPVSIDDNFSIPLGAGAVMTLVQALPAAGGTGVMVMSPLLEGALAAALR